jgi:hypothetical protein
MSDHSNISFGFEQFESRQSKSIRISIRVLYPGFFQVLDKTRICLGMGYMLKNILGNFTAQIEITLIFILLFSVLFVIVYYTGIFLIELLDTVTQNNS